MRFSPIAFAATTACALSCALLTSLDGLGPGATDGEAGVDASDASFTDAVADASAIAAPRPRAPLSGSYVTSQKPTFSWVLPSGVEGAHVDVCADRACATVEQELDQAGASAEAQQLAPGVHYWRLRGRLGETVGVATSPTWEIYVPHRSSGRDASYGAFGDFNGDGFSDLAASINAFAPHSIGFFAGSKAGVGGEIVFSDPQDSAHEEQTRLAAGDVDGDGYVDLIAAAPRQYGDTSSTIGHVSIWAGGDAAFPSGATPKWTIPAPSGVDRFGIDAAFAGDLDGDGYGDLAIAATMPSGALRVFVYFGHAGGPSTAPDVTLDAPNTGGNLAGGGDLDGDGRPELFVWGAPAMSTQSAAFFGAAGGPSNATVHQVSTPSDATSNFGIGSQSVGDLNGDGLVDYVVSDLIAPTDDAGAAGPGTAYVFFGATSSLAALQFTTRLGGEGLPNELFGETASIVGDVNGDGYDDVVVGTVNSHNGAGRAFYFPGGPAGPTNAGRVVLTGDGVSFGIVGASVGDLNDDGYADVAIGGLASSYIRVYYGGPGGISDSSGPQNKLVLTGDLYAIR